MNGIEVIGDEGHRTEGRRREMEQRRKAMKWNRNA